MDYELRDPAGNLIAAGDWADDPEGLAHALTLGPARERRELWEFRNPFTTPDGPDSWWRVSLIFQDGRVLSCYWYDRQAPAEIAAAHWAGAARALTPAGIPW